VSCCGVDFFFFFFPQNDTKGDVLEYATLLSVKAEDVEAFDRNLAQVKAYYSEYW
jgi:hypothetical protein